MISRMSFAETTHLGRGVSWESEPHCCEPENDKAHAGALAGQDDHQRALLAQDAEGDPEGARSSRMQREHLAIPAVSTNI
ncbi:MAG: hypothetical protein PHI11_03475 [Gallionella sp.]|nr:hypothetical protein [Gallionella sp.]